MLKRFAANVIVARFIHSFLRGMLFIIYLFKIIARIHFINWVARVKTAQRDREMHDMHEVLELRRHMLGQH